MKKPVPVGRFLKPFGVKGEIKFLPYYPQYLSPSDLKSGVASAGEPEDGQNIEIESARDITKTWALKTTNYSSPEEVSEIVNMEFFIERDEIPADSDGEYFADDILGLKVFTEEGKELGEITGVVQTGANDVWEVVMPDGKEFMLPVIEQVILSVDIEAGKVVVKLMEGLID